MSFRSLEPSSLPASTLFDLLVETIKPRPIALLSTLSVAGIRNLAPFSFFMIGGTRPPSLMVSPTLGKGGVAKDSLSNIIETKEFVVNLVDREIVEAMNVTATSFPAEVEEWQHAGLTPIASDVVKPGRVAESPFQFECRLHELVRHGEEAGSANYVIGEIVRIHVKEEAWKNGAIDKDSVHVVARLGGSDYLDLSAMEIFTLERPKSDGGASIDK